MRAVLAGDSNTSWCLGTLAAWLHKNSRDASKRPFVLSSLPVVLESVLQPPLPQDKTDAQAKVHYYLDYGSTTTHTHTLSLNTRTTNIHALTLLLNPPSLKSIRRPGISTWTHVPLHSTMRLSRMQRGTPCSIHSHSRTWVCPQRTTRCVCN